MMSSEPSVLSSEPKFNLLSFVEEWRRNKKLADEEVLVGLGDKNKIKIGLKNNTQPQKRLQYNKNVKIMRTLKFETIGEDKYGNEKKTYHTLSN